MNKIKYFIKKNVELHTFYAKMLQRKNDVCFYEDDEEQNFKIFYVKNCLGIDYDYKGFDMNNVLRNFFYNIKDNPTECQICCNKFENNKEEQFLCPNCPVVFCCNCLSLMVLQQKGLCGYCKTNIQKTLLMKRNMTNKLVDTYFKIINCNIDVETK